MKSLRTKKGGMNVSVEEAFKLGRLSGIKECQEAWKIRDEESDNFADQNYSIERWFNKMLKEKK